MRQDSFRRERRIANWMILSALLALVVANSLSIAGVAYMPFRFLAVMGSAITILATITWVVWRHQPDSRSLVVLVVAVVLLGLSLTLQLEAVRESIARSTGLATDVIQRAIADSLTEVALGLLLIVTVSIFIKASYTSYTAGQRTTELEAAQAALLESEERFRRAFEDGPIGMAFVDVNFKLVQVNRILCNHLGYSEQELIGQSIEFITHPDDLVESRAVAQSIFSCDPPSRSYEKRYRKKDGSYFWGSLTASIIRDADGNPMYSFGMVENVTQRRQMEEARRRDQQFLRSLLDLQERERRFIAYEIHDGFVQQTVAAKMHLEAYLCGAEPTPTSHPKQLELAVDALNNAINEGRRMIGELRPLIIDEGGIVAAIDYLVSDGLIKKALPVEFVHDVRFGRLDPLLEGTIFRITQEALTNVWRHSKSPRALVKLGQHDQEIHLEVRDWGIGFNPADVDTSRFGVRGLQERALLFGGKAVIESKPGRGTRILVKLPIIHAHQSPSAASLARSD